MAGQALDIQVPPEDILSITTQLVRRRLSLVGHSNKRNRRRMARRARFARRLAAPPIALF